MKTIHNTLLLILIACGSALSAQADTNNQAPLRLELVANASNPNAYQLHLCDTDIDTCHVALLDAQGNAATIYPHALQRPFFATYKGYALLALTAVATPIVGVRVWRKLMRQADSVLDEGRTAVQKQRHAFERQDERLQEEVARQIHLIDIKHHETSRTTRKELNKALRKIQEESDIATWEIKHNEIRAEFDTVLDLSSNDVTSPFNTENYFKYSELVEKDMPAFLDEIVEHRQAFLAREIELTSDYLDELEIANKAEKSAIKESIAKLAGDIDELDSSIAAKLDEDILSAELAEQDLAKLDEIFADQLAQRKRAFQLGDDGVEFFQMMRTDIRTMHKSVIENLRFLERKQQLLSEIKEGSAQLDVVQLKIELQELNVPVTTFFREHNELSLYYDTFPEDASLLKQLDEIANANYVPGMLLHADAIRAQGGKLYRLAQTHLLEIRVKEASIELAEKIKNNSLDIDAALARLDEDIVAAQEGFFSNIMRDKKRFLSKTEDSHDFAPVQQRLLALGLDVKPPSETINSRLEEIATMKNRLNENKQNMDKSHIAIRDLQQRLEALPDRAAELKKQIPAWEEKLAQVKTKATEQTQQAKATHAQQLEELEQRNLNKLEELEQHKRTQQDEVAQNLRKLVSEEEKIAIQHSDSKSKAQMISAAASASLLGATAAFDRFVWGKKQRQQNQHWQVLSDKRVIKVIDTKGAKKALDSIASISGYHINYEALLALDNTRQ